MDKMAYLQGLSFVLGLTTGLGMLSAGALITIGTLASMGGTYDAQIRDAYQDRNVCEFTAGCDTNAMEERIDELKEKKAERKALHYDRAWKAAVVALCGAGILWGLVFNKPPGR